MEYPGSPAGPGSLGLDLGPACLVDAWSVTPGDGEPGENWCSSMEKTKQWMAGHADMKDVAAH